MRRLLTAAADRLYIRLDLDHSQPRKLALLAYIFGFVDAMLVGAILVVLWEVAK